MFKELKHTYAYLNIFLIIIYNLCRSFIKFFSVKSYNILKFSNKDIT